jgi:putative glycosyltransferase (TIGR04372 family)
LGAGEQLSQFMLKYFRGRNFGYVFRFVLASPLALLIWLVIEIVNIFRPVYIVGLSYKGRITQYMAPMELHLRQANQTKKSYLMIFVMPVATPNEAVRTIYSRCALIIDSHYPKIIRSAFGMLSVLLKRRFMPQLLQHHLLWQLEPATELNKVEIEFGKNLMNDLGIPIGAEYVCLGVKEAAYYAAITPESGFGQDLSHQAKDSRNVDITNYMLAATHLAGLGIYVVRVGSVVSAPLPKDRHPMIIDYASEARSELGDVVLGTNCSFFVCGVSGFWVFTSTKNIPILICDIFECGFPTDLLSQHRKSINILRRIGRKSNSQLVPFSEMAAGGQKWADDKVLASLGLEPIPNTPEEILDAVVEMNDWIDGKLELSDFDEELQTKFYNCYPPETRLEKNPLVRISPSFLRKYQYLL